MGSHEVPLFRVEVARARADRLHGRVSLATPLAWQMIGLLLLAALIASVVFLAGASYARVETVDGVVTLDKGVATIVPSRAGVVAAVEVSEGQLVRAGTVLARIRSEEDMVEGRTAPLRMRLSLRQQDSRLLAQGRLLLSAAEAEGDRLREQIAGLSRERDSLTTQIVSQRRLVGMAEADHERLAHVAADGFISRRDMDAREATILSRRQQLAQLEQLQGAKSASIGEALRAISASGATAKAAVAGAESQRAALAQQLAQTDLARGYSITSPVDGVVTALTGRAGQPANDRQQLMMVVPTDAVPRIELYVPTAAAGFVTPGQDVRLAVDAFPYQQFGTVAARIASVSAATIVRSQSTGTVSVYLVTAVLPRPWIDVPGGRRRLMPGMTLDARIVTERRTLLEWLFQPVLAVRNR